MQLIAENLTVVRGLKPVIRDLSFEVQAGSALILLGANGAGKTTLLRTVAGFLTPSAGTISMLQGGSKGAPEVLGEVAEYCHYVGHANGIRGSLTVRENIEFWARYLGAGPVDHTEVEEVEAGGVSKCVQDALAAFNLQELADIPARYLSAGQTRRLGLARLVAAPRKVWLMDEPTVSLDVKSVALLSGVVERHVANGGLVMAATHIPLGLENAKELKLRPVASVSSDLLLDDEGFVL
ncbi:MAG: heme ABC exporter ATP-binding protein CcmA [Hyphomicrobiaceae bacterium]